MPTFSTSQIPPPVNWQEFESLCCALWRKIWNDPNTQKNGRQGQPQNGVDISGMPNRKDSWAGVQCKGKDNYTQQKLTKVELKEEVEKAKCFEPQLTEFIIATTAPRDGNIQKLARQITAKHIKQGLFSVHVFGWEDIREQLAYYPEVICVHYHEWANSTEGFETTLEALQVSIHCEGEHTRTLFKQEFAKHRENYKPELTITGIEAEHHQELNQARDLIHANMPRAALRVLEGLQARIWATTGSEVKFRILTNIGAAKLNLSEFRDAATKYLEALQYNSNDEKALCNAALAFLLIKQHDQALIFAQKALELNSGNTFAFSIIVRAKSNQYSLDEILAEVPNGLKQHPHVASAIAEVAIQRDDIENALNWLEIAVQNDDGEAFENKALLATVRLERITQSNLVAFGIQLDLQTEEQIRNAITDLTYAWEKVRDTDIRRFRSEWIANCGIAKRLLGDLSGAATDLDAAITADPDVPIYKRQRAIIAFDQNDPDTTIRLLTEIKNLPETPEVNLILAEIYSSISKYDNAIDVISGFLNTTNDERLLREAKLLLLRVYVQSRTKNNLEQAKLLSTELQALYPTDSSVLLHAAKVSNALGQVDTAILLLREAKRCLVEDTEPQVLRHLADDYFALAQYDESATVYEKFVNKTVYSPLTGKLVESYYRSGRLRPALDICRDLRTRYGNRTEFATLESAILEEIGDLGEAKKVCEAYLQTQPGDAMMLVRLASIYMRQADFAKLETLLDSIHGIPSVPIDAALRLAQLYAVRSRPKQALELLYELRHLHPNRAEIHENYIGLFFLYISGKELRFEAGKVEQNTAVLVEFPSGQKEWFILDDREDADIQRKELNHTHPLFERLLGATVGDNVTIRAGQYSEETVIIREIKSKYVYALHKSLEDFHIQFPESKTLERIHVGDAHQKEELRKSLEPVLANIRQDERMFNKIGRLYKGGNITIGAISSLFGKSVITAWHHLTNTPEIGVRCSKGRFGEWQNGLEVLKQSHQPLVVDLLALLVIDQLNILEKVTSIFGKMLLAQSTVDELSTCLLDLKSSKSRGFNVLGTHGDSPTLTEISAEQVQDSANTIETLIMKIKEHSNIMLVKSALDMPRNEKERLENILGRSFIDSILIAHENGSLLVSDDLTLRQFASTEYRVSGVWSQVLLQHLFDLGQLSNAQLCSALGKLVCSNYHHIHISVTDLIESARQVGWIPGFPFICIVRAVNGFSCEEDTAVGVAVNFLYELWKQPILPHQREYLTLSLLDSLTTGRTRNVLSKLLSVVPRRFALLPLGEQEIRRTIDAWMKAHVI